jgi:transcriptional regulator
MYIPSAFAMQDPVKLGEVISSNNFAMLISRDGDSLFASHLPFLYRPEEGAHGKLFSHMARANRHWQLFQENGEALVIFAGPHAYISPNWYANPVTVPTWNYVTVHVYGIPKIIESGAGLEAILDATVAKHEAGLPAPWIPNLPGEMKVRLQQAIVGFEIEITRVEGKFKLSQNRSPEDQAKMLQVLQASGDAESQRLAKIIEREVRG